MYSDNSGGWHDQDNTAVAKGTPAAVGNGLSALFFGGPSPKHAFFIAGDGHVHEMYSDSSGGWHDQDNTWVANGTPAAAGSPLSAFFVGGNSPEHAFFISGDGHVHEMYSDSGGGWHDQDNTAVANGTPAAH
jgi:hypothetical protein